MTGASARVATVACAVGVLLVAGCDTPGQAQPAARGSRHADVRRVRATGHAGRYTFRVTVKSPDTGCERYADWWEVVRPDGTLVYRRILHHSHPKEQPFTRAGGPVPVQPDDTLIVRAHLHPGGYGGRALAGTIADGFTPKKLDPAFGKGLERAEPQPQGCLH